MQNIDLICIGKMNAAYFAAGVAEYQKRLGGFCNFRIIELPEAEAARWVEAVKPILDDYVKQSEEQGLPGSRFLADLQARVKDAAEKRK